MNREQWEAKRISYRVAKWLRYVGKEYPKERRQELEAVINEIFNEHGLPNGGRNEHT